jgi:hypothetical protein
MTLEMKILDISNMNMPDITVLVHCLEWNARKEWQEWNARKEWQEWNIKLKIINFT